MHRRLLLVSLCLTTLAGCAGPRFVVDPSFPKVAFEDLKKRAQPLPLTLVVEFRRNGEPFPKADAMLRDNAERVLRASGLIVPVTGPSEGEIRVVMNNVADLGQAAAKSFGSGLTFGLVGTTVTDAYEIEVAVSTNGKTIRRSDVKHAIHTSVGNATLPAGAEAVDPAAAFDRVLEQMLLYILRDMQQSGELSRGWDLHLVKDGLGDMPRCSAPCVFDAFGILAEVFKRDRVNRIPEWQHPFGSTPEDPASRVRQLAAYS
jgi:hypothetical protein